MPQMSIIIPVYNAESYLKRCIDSVLVQTFTDFELLLIDDGSPDRCGEICDMYVQKDKRVQVFHCVNKGPSAARNKGIAKAKGIYLMFLDSDDYWQKEDFLEKVYLEINEHNVDMVIFDFIKYSEKWSKFSELPLEYNLNKINAKQSHDVIGYLVGMDQFQISPCLRVVRRELLTKNNIIFDETLLSGEDIDWSIKLWLCIDSIRALNYPMYVYRIRLRGTSVSAAKLAWKYRYIIICRWYSYICNHKNINEQVKQSLLGFLAYQYYIMLGDIANMKDQSQKISAYQKAKKLKSIIDYDVNKKTHISKIIVRLLGIKCAAHLFNLYIRTKR